MAQHLNPVEVEKVLKGIHYPVDKNELVKYAQQHGADKSMSEALQYLPDQTFHTPVEVSKAVGEVDRQK